MKRTQLTITYPASKQLEFQELQLRLKEMRFVNASAFCREAIAEKLLRTIEGGTP